MTSAVSMTTVGVSATSVALGAAASMRTVAVVAAVSIVTIAVASA